MIRYFPAGRVRKLVAPGASWNQYLRNAPGTVADWSASLQMPLGADLPAVGNVSESSSAVSGPPNNNEQLLRDSSTSSSPVEPQVDASKVSAAGGVDPLEATPPHTVVNVPRDSSWVAVQRPIPQESSVTSHAYEEAVAASMNPPEPFLELASTGEELWEYQSRLVVGIGLGISSGFSDVETKGVESLPLYNTLLPTFFPVAQPNYIYRYVHDSDSCITLNSVPNVALQILSSL
jgi:hypothetical protein